MRKEYTSQGYKDGDFEKSEAIKEKFSELHDLIEATAPANRYRSIAITDIEKASMVVTKSFTHNEEK
jgi:hypothetical protein